MIIKNAFKKIKEQFMVVWYLMNMFKRKKEKNQHSNDIMVCILTIIVTWGLIIVILHYMPHTLDN